MNIVRSISLSLLLSAAPYLARAQDVVAGTIVVGGSQRPLPGAQVSIEGQTGKGATADANGRFRVTGVTGTQVTLNVRLVGYRPETQSVRVGATDIRVTMSERAISLDQVVVTGTAGGEQRRALGTSVAAVDASDIMAKAAVPTIDGLLNGRAPGVVILPQTGQAGAGGQDVRAWR